MAETLPVRFLGGRVLLGEQDVTDAIRTEEAGMNASRVSALPAVRTALVALQQGFRRLPGLVADGRDMGTVIFPDAQLKVYLTASAAQRAERRHKQLISKGNSVYNRQLFAQTWKRATPGIRPAPSRRSSPPKMPSCWITRANRLKNRWRRCSSGGTTSSPSVPAGKLPRRRPKDFRQPGPHRPSRASAPRQCGSST